MKIACIGNMNNTFFSIVRYIRDRGVDAHLLLLDKGEFPHFHPSRDSYDLEYQKFTKTLPWGNPIDFLKTPRERVRKSMEDYDFLIGCNSAPAFLRKIGRPLDIFIPFGGDIVENPFFKFYKNPEKQLNYLLFSRCQRAGIGNARYLSMDETNDDVEKIVRRLKIKGKRLKMAAPFLYTPVYNPLAISGYYDRSSWYKEFKKIRENHDVIVFHHSRHIWKNVSDKISYKGNYKLVRGFALFLKGGTRSNPCLVMFEYGCDVSETKKLVSELGIERYVKWFPQIDRKEIMIGISLSDIGAGEFGMSWLSYGVIYEIMAMGKPVMHHREDGLYRGLYPELYPMIHANTQEEVARALTDYVSRKDYYKKMGEDARVWFQRYAVDQPINEYLGIIQGRARC